MLVKNGESEFRGGLRNRRNDGEDGLEETGKEEKETASEQAVGVSEEG